LLDLLVTDPVTGKRTGLAGTVRRVVREMRRADVRYCVIGASALAVRGFPRMTRDLDLVVMLDDATAAWAALEGAGLVASTPTGTPEDPESMVVFVDPKTKVDVDLLVAAGDPEATVLEQATDAQLFGARARVAELEHLLLLYLYSNQPKHLGDFATIARSGKADLARVERLVRETHPEMLPDLAERLRQARHPEPAPKRPPPRKR